MLTKEDLLAISELMNPLREDIAGIKDDIVEMKGDIAELKVDVAGLKVDVVKLNEEVAGMKRDIADLKGDVEGLKGDVEGLKGDVVGLKGDVVGLKGDVEGLKGDVAGLTKRLGKNEEAIHGLGTLVENETGRMVNLLVEGHESLRQIVECRLATKEEAEESRTRIFALEEIAKKHTAQIEELQKKTG